MRKQSSRTSDHSEFKPSPEASAGYVPKSYGRRETIILLLKMTAIAAGILVLLWLV
jgi:hypothetical protein